MSSSVNRTEKDKRYRKAHKTEIYAYNTDWKRRNAERAKDYELKYNYGISLEDYKKILEKQGDKCAICKTDKPGGKHKYFHVDHDHRTKRVRGLLCDKCNRGIGYFDDQPERLREAAIYLENLDGNEASNCNKERSQDEKGQGDCSGGSWGPDVADPAHGSRHSGHVP